MTILIGIIIGLIGLSVGVIIGFILCFMFRRISSYSGIMRVIREDDKITYSLELQDNPIMLEHVNEVVFKVETSDKSSNRK